MMLLILFIDVAQANLPQFVQLQMWLKPQYKRGKSLNALLKPCDFKGTLWLVLFSYSGIGKLHLFESLSYTQWEIF